MRYLLTTLCLVLIFCISASAATITVTNTNDSGVGSLRQAIADAAPGDTINFSAIGTITLTSGQLVIDKNLTIQGPGQSLLSISGNNLSRVLNINSSVTLDGMTIRDAGGDYGEGKGRGIENLATLTVSNSTISGNRAGRFCDELGQCSYDYGGGIANYGTLAVINSTVSGNAAGDANQWGGGGIFNSGMLTVTNSAISGNGVGCYVSPGDLGCWSGDGGGIYNYQSGTLTVNNSTISGNGVSGSGGGILNYGTLSVNNSTVSHNHVPVGHGGGILNFHALTVTNSTISGNTGWGIAAFDGAAETKLNNSIVAGNSGRYNGFPIPNDILVHKALITSASHNLIGDAASSGGITNGVNGNIVGVNPLLGPLQNNGGPTLTHALLTGSPAINAGNNCVLTANGCGNGNLALLTDQRGFGRSGTVDIGAFERNPSIDNFAPFDYDGDGKSDLSVFRPVGATWHIAQSGGGIRVQGWGMAGDKLTPADFDGDGKTDLAVFRPSEGNWYILNSSNNTVTSAGWGNSTDKLVPGDYNGDGKADFAVFRESEGRWYRRDTDGQVHFQDWGLPGDKPAPADFDGDGRLDLTVFRPSEGRWYTIRSSDAAITTTDWGAGGDIPVAADYSGDGKADFVVFRPSDLTWYRRHSDDSTLHFITWGLEGDIPAPGDYDGDGKTDLAVYRNGVWYLMQSTAGISVRNWGLAADRPVPAAYLSQN